MRFVEEVNERSGEKENYFLLFSSALLSGIGGGRRRKDLYWA
jgi:hypothetical protein